MTPLFAATQASQSVAMSTGTLDQSLGGSRGSGVHLRATQQALAFTPTQGQLTGGCGFTGKCFEEWMYRV